MKQGRIFMSMGLILVLVLGPFACRTNDKEDTASTKNAGQTVNREETTTHESISGVVDFFEHNKIDKQTRIVFKKPKVYVCIFQAVLWSDASRQEKAGLLSPGDLLDVVALHGDNLTGYARTDQGFFVSLRLLEKQQDDEAISEEHMPLPAASKIEQLVTDAMIKRFSHSNQSLRFDPILHQEARETVRSNQNAKQTFLTLSELPSGTWTVTLNWERQDQYGHMIRLAQNSYTTPKEALLASLQLLPDDLYLPLLDSLWALTPPSYDYLAIATGVHLYTCSQGLRHYRVVLYFSMPLSCIRIDYALNDPSAVLQGAQACLSHYYHDETTNKAVRCEKNQGCEEHEHMTPLFRHADMEAWFEDNLKENYLSLSMTPGIWHDKTSVIISERDPTYNAGYQAMENLFLSLNEQPDRKLLDMKDVAVSAWTIFYRDESRRHFIRLELSN